MKNAKFIISSLSVCLLMSGCGVYSNNDFYEAEYLPTTEYFCSTGPAEESAVNVFETVITEYIPIETEVMTTTGTSQAETTCRVTAESTEVTKTMEPWYWCWTDYEDTVLNIPDYPSGNAPITAALMCPPTDSTGIVVEEMTANTYETTAEPNNVQVTTDKMSGTLPSNTTEKNTNIAVPADESVSLVDDYSRKYYYNTLTKSQKEYYRYCFNQKRYLLSDPEPKLPDSDKRTALFAMNRDNPHLLLYPTQYTIDNGFTSMTAEKRSKIFDKATAIADKARKYNRTFDRLKCIHDELCDMLDFMSSRDMISAFLNGKANCSGYADAFCFICQLSEIDCVVVHGTAKSGNGLAEHAWNMVKIDDTWYNIDVCWDDVKHDRYTYFLRSDKAFGKNHITNMPVSCPKAPKKYPVDYLGNETV